jgi:hypothetical protein
MSVVPPSGALAQTRLPSKFDQQLASILDNATTDFLREGL